VQDRDLLAGRGIGVGMSPPVPTSEVTEAISRCSATNARRYSAKCGAPSWWRTIVATWI
jgi:hypothetical protein